MGTDNSVTRAQLVNAAYEMYLIAHDTRIESRDRIAAARELKEIYAVLREA